MLMLLLASAAFAQAGGPASSVTMGDVEVRLFYKETGRLSDNVLGRKKDFTFHNTVIGEGDAEESADDVLVSVAMSAGKFGTPEDNHKFVNSPVELVARDRTGRILGRRKHDSVLTSYAGKDVKVLWLNDVTCTGEVTITALYAGKSKSTKVVMGCGE